MNVSTFLDWLLRSSCQASVLICLVLGLQWALRRWIDVRTRYLLWLLVVVRLALPWAPQSRLSLYNLLPDTPRKGYEAFMGPEAGVGPTYSAERDEIYAARPLDSSGSVAYDPAQRVQAPMSYESTDRILVSLALFWLAGAGALGVYTLVSNVRIWRMVRRMRPVTDPQILALLDDCRQQMGIRSPVTMMASEKINGPALFGVLRARLLLPSQLLAEMEPNELRYVLLHELAHLRRHDILVSIVTSGLQILHWFNPLISHGLLRMRADRELACDGLALSQLHPHEASAYGRTIVRLVEQLIMPRPHLLLAGFLGDRARIKQRVAMISLFRRETYQWSPLALVLVGIVGCTGLTNGRAVDRPGKAQVQPPELHQPSEAPATAHGFPNIMRIYIRHHQMDKYLVANGRSVVSADEPGETGLWEARFNGEFTPDGAMLIYSVSLGMYLGIDDQGNLAVNQRTPDKWAHWSRKAGPLGAQVKSQEFQHGYLRLEEQGQVSVVQMGRDLPSQWDIMQLGLVTETKQK
jgi:beta-lactamase regulating signal transducer with metallopeptidase domain